MHHVNTSSPPLPNYDFIIAGAGCAGLSLLHYILNSPLLSSKQILVIDASLTKTNDRTWCFWEKEVNDFENLVQNRWDTISIHHQGFSKELPIAPFTYKMIQGIDFYNMVINEAKSYTNVHWLEAAISKLEVIKTPKNNKEVKVQWEGGSVLGKNVFNSILPFQMSNLKSANQFGTVNSQLNTTPFLWQHFKGRMVQYDKPIFNHKVGKLMDFNVPQMGGTAFMYVLPFSDTQALVEFTIFSAAILEVAQYDHVMNEYLQGQFPDLHYTIQHEELGAIPMTLQNFSISEAPIYAIGALGSAIKASTGYAFQFIQSQCKKIVKQLEQGHQLDTNVHQTRHRLYDAVLLHVLYYHKMEGAEIFSRIFAKNNPATVFKFLSNTSNILEEIQIMRSLPSRVFLPAAISVLMGRS